ncbi:hypothetical protein ACROYT_G032306 [Oculina patagonica]
MILASSSLSALLILVVLGNLSFAVKGYSCGYRYDSAAFLFSLVNRPGWKPLKLDENGNYHSYSIYSCSAYGPTFGGGHDIYIASYASSSTSSYTNLGHDYGPPAGYSYGSSEVRSFLAGTYYNFQPDEVEVFYETT